MGSGLRLECRSCGREENFIAGIGMMYAFLEDVLDFAVPAAKRKKIRALLEHKGLVQTEYEHRIYACPRCRTLHNRFYIKIEHDLEKVYETRFRCGKCRAALVPARGRNFSTYRCSFCGKKSLFGRWDICWD